MVRRETSTFKPSQFKNRETSVETGASVRNTIQSGSFTVGQKTEDVQREDEGMDDDTGTHTDSSAIEEEGHAEKRVSSSRRQRIRDVVLIFYSKFGTTVNLAGMVIVGLGYSILAEYLGSSRLLGAFVAGVLFSDFEDLCHRYEKQIAHKIQPVMNAVFFATIGFAIPLTTILEPVLFGWGLVYAVIATLSKLTTMITRGELGLLMVQQAQMEGVMGQTTIVITTWSIVLATLFGVGTFSVVMKRKIKT
ncbi:hypothetical protein KI688_011137 [Linnemannia hyalina]|uniref:Cation/H+ exchanger transmembrane domain-containing protein n=1 Tax=Linnemannia hyalina TaxID=64524 RepID=A0A9P7XWW3_9FUNG|nr:hypothetical protein KI688_011137 [Linnemannia hyalina]